MSDLQAKIEDFIYRWQPGESTTFNIGLEYSIGDILEVERDREDVIADRGDSYDGNLSAWFELDELELTQRYIDRMAEWKKEKEMNDEFYGRRAI